MNPPPNLNRLARLYRWMELCTFGPWLWWCRCAYLREMTECRHAAVLGDGDGRFVTRLLHENPTISIDAVEASPAMVAVMRQRASQYAGRLRAHCADVRLWHPSGAAYDLIVTHFFLDFLTDEEVEALAVRLRRAAAPGGLWIVSEFAVPATLFGRLVAQPVVWGLYRSFALLTGLKVRTLPDHPAALRKAGFALRERRCWLRGLLVSERWEAVQPGSPAS